jgi:hypothetical protein
MKRPRDRLYARHRFPAAVISHAVWLYFRFPLSLRMIEEMLAVRGIDVSHETIRRWVLKFGQEFANGARRRLPTPGDKWHMDEASRGPPTPPFRSDPLRSRSPTRRQNRPRPSAATRTFALLHSRDNNRSLAAKIHDPHDFACSPALPPPSPIRYESGA